MTAPSILVLEDDELVRMLLVEIIEDMGAVVVSYGSADEGMAFLERGADQLSLIISDINMPGVLDGYDLSKIVTLRWPSLPMILTSGKVQAVLELGANVSFLAKPWTGGAMLDSVSCVLDQLKRSDPH